jgi:Stanniocalcin family
MCIKFRSDRMVFSSAGRKWMLDTMHCLQDALVPEATGATNITTCDALEDKAFGTHAACYMKSGFCLLSPEDWVSVVDIVQLKRIFGNWDAFKATVQASKDCVELWAFLLEKKLIWI